MLSNLQLSPKCFVVGSAWNIIQTIYNASYNKFYSKGVLTTTLTSVVVFLWAQLILLRRSDEIMIKMKLNRLGKEYFLGFVMLALMVSSGILSSIMGYYATCQSTLLVKRLIAKFENLNQNTDQK